MVCSDINELIHAYLDRELDLSRSLEVEHHLKACEVCSRVYTEQKALQSAIARSSLYHEAPNDLRRRVRTELRRVANSERPSRWRWDWRVLWAPFSVTALALLLVFAIVTRPSAEDRLSDEILSAHIRSLMPGHLIDIPSSDQHTVKPWFNGRLDFSPPVRDLADRGFPLIGGRLDYVSGQPVAAVVYQRRKHVINLFIWPAGRSPGEEAVSRQGYNVLCWTQKSMSYCAVSDVNTAELEEFASMLR